MRIKFLYIENGKITLTKHELEQLLEESYQDGVAEGRKNNSSSGTGLAYQPEKLRTPDYYTTPYWGIDRSIPVTCNDPNVVKISSTGDPLGWAENGTTTISSSCADNDCVYSACSTSFDEALNSAKTYTDGVISAHVSALSDSSSDPAAIATITSVKEE